MKKFVVVLKDTIIPVHADDEEDVAWLAEELSKDYQQSLVDIHEFTASYTWS